jgi:hypothetical protein
MPEDRPVETRRFNLVIPNYKWGYDADGKYGRTDLPSTNAVVDVTVNWQQIAQSLGEKAVKSKGGKTQEISGLVMVFKVSETKQA